MDGIKTINTGNAQDDADRKMIFLTPEYVDCECDDNYIKAVPKGGPSEGQVACMVCGALFEEQPDARVDEVEAAGLPFDPSRVEFAGFS